MIGRDITGIGCARSRVDGQLHMTTTVEGKSGLFGLRVLRPDAGAADGLMSPVFWHNLTI